jgi:prophage antirepressor-like protein
LDDIVDFTGYSRKDHAKNFLVKNMRKNQDYVDLKLSEIEGRENIISPHARGNKNKRFIFVTKFAFYSFIMMANTTRAKNIRMQMIDIYNTYHDLLMY